MSMQIDPRGQRFSAALSTVVLAAVVVTGNVWLLAAQTAVFGVSAVLGLRYSPYGLLYRSFIEGLLGPPARTEAAAGPRFAQGVGLVISAAGVAGYGAGWVPLGLAATSAALAAAFLNAAFGLCLGCELHVLIQRARPARTAMAPAERDKEVTA